MNDINSDVVDKYLIFDEGVELVEELEELVKIKGAVEFVKQIDGRYFCHSFYPKEKDPLVFGSLTVGHNNYHFWEKVCQTKLVAFKSAMPTEIAIPNISSRAFNSIFNSIIKKEKIRIADLEAETHASDHGPIIVTFMIRIKSNKVHYYIGRVSDVFGDFSVNPEKYQYFELKSNLKSWIDNVDATYKPKLKFVLNIIKQTVIEVREREKSIEDILKM